MLRGACTLRSVMASDNMNAHMVDKMLLVTLDGTSINPLAPPAFPDGPRRLNWYVDQVDIEIGFTGTAPAGLERSNDVPSTASLKGQSQSSISTTLSVGFFGDSATGSFSQTWSYSFGIQLQDFGIERDSIGNDVKQHMYMEMSKSAVYSKPEDLINGPVEWPARNPASSVFSPPDAAITNVDIPTQCIYKIDGGEIGVFTFQIKLTPRFVFLRARPKNYSEEDPRMQMSLISVNLDPLMRNAEGYNYTGYPYNMMMDIEVATPTFIWEFPIDFSKVGLPG